MNSESLQMSWVFSFEFYGMVKHRPAPGSQNPPYIWHMAALNHLSHLILFSHFANHSRKVVAQEPLLIPISVLKWYCAFILYDILIICNWLHLLYFVLLQIFVKNFIIIHKRIKLSGSYKDFLFPLTQIYHNT